MIIKNCKNCKYEDIKGEVCTTCTRNWDYEMLRDNWERKNKVKEEREQFDD